MDHGVRPRMLILQQALLPAFAVVEDGGLVGILQLDVILAVNLPGFGGLMMMRMGPRRVVRKAMALARSALAADILADSGNHGSAGFGQTRVENGRRGHEEPEK